MTSTGITIVNEDGGLSAEQMRSIIALVSPSKLPTHSATVLVLPGEYDALPWEVDGKQYTEVRYWGIRAVEMRRDPDSKGFWARRVVQKSANADAYELQVGGDESFFLQGPDGKLVQFDGKEGNVALDAKCVVSVRSIYFVEETRSNLREKIIEEARRQVTTVSANGMTVEWRVSNKKAADQLRNLFESLNLDITVTHQPADENQ